MKRAIARLLTGVIIMMLSFSVLTGCSTDRPTTDTAVTEDYVEGKELMCLVDSKEEAEKIAKQYGIVLVEYSYGVATFHTEDDPNSVIELGKQLGYTELSLNGTVHTY